MPPKRILAVDDEASWRRLLFRRLTRAGFDCVVASSGAKALAAASSQRLDGIVLDLRLRDMTGFEVARRLADDERTASIPVVMITGEDRAVDLISSAAAFLGRAIFVPKTAPLNELVRCVADAVSRGERPAAAPGLLRRGDLTIDLRLKRVVRGEAALELGGRRFQVLQALAGSREGLPLVVLRGLVWGRDDEPLNTVVKTVNRLRQDLRRAFGREMIETIPGGYRLS